MKRKPKINYRVIKKNKKPTDCNHENRYHFHDNAPPYCPDCDTYPNI